MTRVVVLRSHPLNQVHQPERHSVSRLTRVVLKVSVIRTIRAPRKKPSMSHSRVLVVPMSHASVPVHQIPKVKASAHDAAPRHSEDEPMGRMQIRVCYREWHQARVGVEARRIPHTFHYRTHMVNFNPRLIFQMKPNRIFRRVTRISPVRTSRNSRHQAHRQSSNREREWRHHCYHRSK